jgi:hypothetical protein
MTSRDTTTTIRIPGILAAFKRAMTERSETEPETIALPIVTGGQDKKNTRSPRRAR